MAASCCLISGYSGLMADQVSATQALLMAIDRDDCVQGVHLSFGSDQLYRSQLCRYKGWYAYLQGL